MGKRTEYHRRYRAANRERMSESDRRWKAANPERAKKTSREWARRNRHKSLAYQKSEKGREVKWAAKMKLRHGLTRQQHANLITSQGGVCAICREPFVSRTHTHVDHDHKRTRTQGNIRGVLCSHCNRGLGGARDRIEVLRAMIAYLEVRQCGA